MAEMHGTEKPGKEEKREREILPSCHEVNSSSVPCISAMMCRGRVWSLNIPFKSTLLVTYFLLRFSTPPMVPPAGKTAFRMSVFGGHSKSN
jgi:hypothetical protein